jgi:hypothetical protein
MHAVLIRALYPPSSLLDCLLSWTSIAAHLREPPRKKRAYQIEKFKKRKFS